MRKILVLVAVLLGLLLAASAAFACTGYLVGEVPLPAKSGRRNKLCIYDHMGDTYAITAQANALCKVSINVRHDNEDRDGDGVEDDEEGDE